MMRQGKPTKAYSRWTRHAKKRGATDSRRYYGLLSVALAGLFLSSQTLAQNVTPGISQITASGNSALTTSVDKGTAFAEIIRSKGSASSYVLTKSNILVDTLNVYAGGRLLTLNQDYWFDSASSAIYLQINLSRYETLSVDYRYLEKAPANASVSSFLPNMRLNLNNTTQMGLTFGAATNNGAGLNISTYGLSLNSMFGAQNLSNYRSLMFFSNTADSDNMVLKLNPNEKAAENKEARGAGSLILQDANYKAGAFSVRGGYQDVGTNFNGFKTLRANYANDAEMLKQITELEGQRGMHRMSFGLGVATGGKKQPLQGLQFDMNQIQDGSGSINRQSMGFTGQNVLLAYSTRSISKTFGRMKDLSLADKNNLLLDIYHQFDNTYNEKLVTDVDRAQLVNEVGISRSALNAGFGSAKGTGLQLSQLSLADETLQTPGKGLQRENVALNAKKFGVSYTRQTVGASFSKIASLTDMERGFLALDMLKGFNPNGTLGMVTAIDRAQMSKAAGLTRNVMRFDGMPGKDSLISLSQIGITDTPLAMGTDPAATTSGMSRTQASLQARNFNISFLKRKSDLAFHRIADLTDIEKTFLALDVRRLYDPAATPEQVTPKEREQVAREVGIERSAMQLNTQLGKQGKGGTLTLSQFRLGSQMTPSQPTANASSLHRSALTYVDKKVKLSVINQSADANLMGLTGLSDLELANLGNEHGLRRQQLLLTWLANKSTQIGFQSLSIGNTADALLNPLSSGQSSNPARMSMNREKVTVDTKGMNLAIGVSDTSKSFSRGADLALPAAEKPGIELDRGFKKYEYGLKIAPTKTLKLDTGEIWATNPDDGLGRTTYHHNLEFTPDKKLAILFKANGDMTTASGLRNGMDISSFSLTKILSKAYTFTWTKDQNVTIANDVATQGARTELFTLGTPDSVKNPLKLQRKQVDFFDGTRIDTTIVNAKIKPSKDFTFGLSLESMDKGEQGNEFANGVDFSWQATKKFAIIAGISHRDVQNPQNPQNTQTPTTTPLVPLLGDVNIYTVGMTGEPLKDVRFAASFNEIHQISINTKDVADVSLSNAKPIRLGPLQDFIITARYAALNDQRKMMTEVMTGKATWKLWKNEFMLDYGGNIDKTGEAISRTYFFSTDPNPKLSFKGSFYYKQRTMLDGSEKMIRRFTASARLSRATSLNYLFGTLQEDEKLNVLPILTTDTTLKHNFHKDLALEVFYRLSDNSATKIMTRSFGGGFEGQLNKSSKLTLTFSADGNRWPDRYDNSNHLRLALEHNLNANRFLSLSADIRSHDAPNLPDEITAMADFRIRF